MGSSVMVAAVLSLGLAVASSHPALASVETRQVSVNRRGGDPRGDSQFPSISADGRYVAFESRAGDLVPDDHNI
jgi:Tol biopolymer transport system component